MKSIERRSDVERVGGLADDAGREVRVDLHFIYGANVGKCTVESSGEVYLAQ